MNIHRSPERSDGYRSHERSDWNSVASILNATLSIAIALVLAPSLLHAAGLDEILRDLQRVQTFSAPSISPNGRWITWTEDVDGSETKGKTFLLDRTVNDAKPVQIGAADSSGSLTAHEIAWSPDSTRIAFLSNSGTEQDQVFVLSVPDGTVRQISSLNGYVTHLRWSHDGSQLAFLYAQSGSGGGPLLAEQPQVGEIGSAIHNQRLTLIGADGASQHEISQPDLNIYEYDWSQDGNSFVATAAPGPADNNWWTAKLYTVDAASGKMTLRYTPPVQQQLAMPRWSPDGKKIAFIGGLMSDEGFTGGDIFLLENSATQPRNLTAAKKFSASSLRWRGDDQIEFTSEVEGGGTISTLSVSNGETEVLWKGSQAVHEGGNYPNLALSADAKTAAVVLSTWEHPPEVWAGPVGSWGQLTNANANAKAYWGKAESLTWHSGPYRVQGWLLYPENFDPSQRYPMIVSIHGGPSSEHSASWPSTHFDMSVMAALGYFVFFPNPRGSYGEGESFTRANVRDFGGGDLRDILAGIDTVLSKAPVDNDHIGVTGWSYGGYMTMWTVTQTNRFHAAVAGAGIADWISYYGENLIDQWMIPYFGASVYNNPQVYVSKSPITYIKRVKTPTLILVGERDAECPSPQSFEFWHALNNLGVPTSLVVYPGEGHAFHELKNNIDRMRRTAAWFDKYLNQPSQPISTPKSKLRRPQVVER